MLLVNLFSIAPLARAATFQESIGSATIGHVGSLVFEPQAAHGLSEELAIMGGFDANVVETPSSGFLNVSEVLMYFKSLPVPPAQGFPQIHLFAANVGSSLPTAVTIRQLSMPVVIGSGSGVFPVQNLTLEPGERLGVYNPHGALNLYACTDNDTCNPASAPATDTRMIVTNLGRGLDVVGSSIVNDFPRRLRLAFRAVATRIRAESPVIWNNAAAKQVAVDPFNVTTRSPLRNQSWDFAVKCTVECSATGGVETSRTLLTSATLSLLGGLTVANCSEIHNITAHQLCSAARNEVVAVVVSAQSFDVYRAPSPIVTAVIPIRSSSQPTPAHPNIIAGSHVSRQLPDFPGRYYPEVLLAAARGRSGEPSAEGTLLLCALTRGATSVVDQDLLLDMTEDSWRRAGRPLSPIIPPVLPGPRQVGDSVATPFLCSGSLTAPAGTGSASTVAVSLAPEESAAFVALQLFVRAVGTPGTVSGQLNDSAITNSSIFELMPPRPVVDFNGTNVSRLEESWLPSGASFDALTPESIVPMIRWNFSSLPTAGNGLQLIDGVDGHTAQIDYKHLQGRHNAGPLQQTGVGIGPMTGFRDAIAAAVMPQLLLVRVRYEGWCDTPSVCQAVFAIAVFSDENLSPDLGPSTTDTQASFPDGIDPGQTVPRISVRQHHVRLSRSLDTGRLLVAYDSNRRFMSSEAAQFVLMCYFQLIKAVTDSAPSEPPEFDLLSNGSLPATSADIYRFDGRRSAAVTLPGASAPDIDIGRWQVCGKTSHAVPAGIDMTISIQRPGRYVLHALFAPIPGTIEAVLWKPGPAIEYDCTAFLGLYRFRTELEHPRPASLSEDLVALRPSRQLSVGEGWASCMVLPSDITRATAAASMADTYVAAGGVFRASLGIPGATYSCQTMGSNAVFDGTNPANSGASCGADDPVTGDAMPRVSVAVVKASWPEGQTPSGVRVLVRLPPRMTNSQDLAAWAAQPCSGSQVTPLNFVYTVPVKPLLASPAYSLRLLVRGSTSIDRGGGPEDALRPGNATALLRELNTGRADARLPLLWFSPAGSTANDDHVVPASTRVVSARVPVQLSATGVWPDHMRVVCRIQQACIDGRRGASGSVSFDQSLPCWHSRVRQLWIACDGKPAAWSVLNTATSAKSRGIHPNVTAVWDAAVSTEATAFAQGRGISGDVRSAFPSVQSAQLEHLDANNSDRLATVLAAQEAVDLAAEVYLGTTNGTNLTATGIGIVKKGLFRVTAAVVETNFSSTADDWQTRLPTASWVRGTSDILVVARSTLPPVTVQATSERHAAGTSAAEQARDHQADGFPTVISEALVGVRGAPVIITPALNAYVSRRQGPSSPVRLDPESGAVVSTGSEALPSSSYAIRAAVWEPWARNSSMTSGSTSSSSPIPIRVTGVRHAVQAISRESLTHRSLQTSSITGHTLLDSEALHANLRPGPLGSGIGLNLSAVAPRNESIPAVSAFVASQGIAAAEDPVFLRQLTVMCGANPSVLQWEMPFVMQQGNASAYSFSGSPVSDWPGSADGVFACGEAPWIPYGHNTSESIALGFGSLVRPAINPESPMTAGATQTTAVRPSLTVPTTALDPLARSPHSLVSALLPGAGMYRIAAVAATVARSRTRELGAEQSPAMSLQSSITRMVDVSPTWDLQGGEPFAGAYGSTNDMAAANKTCFKGVNASSLGLRELHKSRLDTATRCEAMLRSSALVIAPLLQRGTISANLAEMTEFLPPERCAEVFAVMHGFLPWSGVLEMAAKRPAAAHVASSKSTASPLQTRPLAKVRGCNSRAATMQDMSRDLDASGVVGLHRHVFLDDLTYKALFEAASQSGQTDEWMPVNATATKWLPPASVPAAELATSLPSTASGLSKEQWDDKLAQGTHNRVPFALGVACDVVHPHGVFPWFSPAGIPMLESLPVFRAFGVDCISLWITALRHVQLLTQYDQRLRLQPNPNISPAPLTTTLHQVMYGTVCAVPITPEISLATAFEPTGLALDAQLIAAPDLNKFAAEPLRPSNLASHWSPGGLLAQDPESWGARLEAIWSEHGPTNPDSRSQPALAPYAVGGEGFVHKRGLYTSRLNESSPQPVYFGEWKPVDASDPRDIAERLLMGGISGNSLRGGRVLILPAPAMLTLPTVVISGAPGIGASTSNHWQTAAPSVVEWLSGVGDAPSAWSIGFTADSAWSEELFLPRGSVLFSNITVDVLNASALTEISVEQPHWAAQWHNGWAGVSNVAAPSARRLSGRTAQPNRTFLDAVGVGVGSEAVTASFRLLPSGVPSVCEQTLELLVPVVAARLMNLPTTASAGSADVAWVRVSDLRNGTSVSASIGSDRFARSVLPEMNRTGGLAVDKDGWILTSMPLDAGAATSPKLRCIGEGRLVVQTRLDAVVQNPEAWVPGRTQQLNIAFEEYTARQRDLVHMDVSCSLSPGLPAGERWVEAQTGLPVSPISLAAGSSALNATADWFAHHE
jgi:hypothetical protein